MYITIFHFSSRWTFAAEDCRGFRPGWTFAKVHDRSIEALLFLFFYLYFYFFFAVYRMRKLYLYACEDDESPSYSYTKITISFCATYLGRGRYFQCHLHISVRVKRRAESTPRKIKRCVVCALGSSYLVRRKVRHDAGEDGFSSHWDRHVCYWRAEARPLWNRTTLNAKWPINYISLYRSTAPPTLLKRARKDSAQR